MFFKKLFSLKLDDYFFNFLFVCLFSTKEQQNYKTEKKMGIQIQWDASRTYVLVPCSSLIFSNKMNRKITL